MDSLAEPRIAVVSIMLNAEPFLDAWLKQARYIAGENGKVIVTEGAVCAETDSGFGVTAEGSWFDKDGHSNDSTLSILSKQPDVQLVTRSGLWESKHHMYQAQEEFYDDIDYLWLIEADEFYSRESIDIVRHHLRVEQPSACEFQYLQFFGSMLTYVEAPPGEWGKIPVFRIFKLDRGTKWLSHRPVELVTPEGQKVTEMKPTRARYFEIIPGFNWYHYAYVTKDQLNFKAQYYKAHYPEKAQLLLDPDLSKAIVHLSPQARIEMVSSIPDWWYSS